MVEDAGATDVDDTAPGAVDEPEELTVEWLNRALRSAGHGLEVCDAGVGPIGTGQTGRTFRVQMDYAGNPGPSALIAKLAGGDEATRRTVGIGYGAEVGFYRHLAPDLGVRTPSCWYASITEDNMRFTLLLDDATPALPGVQAEGCSVSEARAALANLVGLHAPRWNDEGLRDLGFLPRSGKTMATMTAEIMPGATETFVDRFRSALTDDEIRTLREVAHAIGPWQLARRRPFSVIHGDYRLDNLLFHPTDGSVVAVDWQTAAVGVPLRDVAYFLGTSLDTDVRRRHEEALVDEYHTGLTASGVSDYDAQQCWEDYRLSQLQGPLVTVVGCVLATGERSAASDEMFLAMTRRACAAINDLGSLDLIG